MAAFEELGLCPELIRAVEEEDWLLPTPIQAEAIPLILGGGDVCAAAETGGGKTGAFALPALQIVHETLRHEAAQAAAAATAAAATTAAAGAARSGGGGGGRTASAAAAGAGGKDICFSEHDVQVIISDGGRRCCCADARAWRGARVNAGVLDGKYMFEVELLSEGLVRVGWASRLSKFEIGIDSQSFGFGATGKKSYNRRFDDYGEAFGMGDVVGCLLDRTSSSSSNCGSISFFLNGKSLGIAFSIPSEMKNTPLHPAVCGKGFDVLLRVDELRFPVEGCAALGLLQPQHDARFLSSFCAEQQQQDTNGGGAAAGGGGRRGGGSSSSSLRCIILEPTRDLAAQTFRCLQNFGRYLESPSIRVALCTGGAEDDKQQRAALSKGGVHIVVGTLQKTMECIRRGFFDLQQLRFLILDEADELIKNDALADIIKIKQSSGVGMLQRQGGAGAGAAGQRVQVLFFSATLHSEEVQKAVAALTQHPTWADLKGKATVPDTVHAVVCCLDTSTTLLHAAATAAGKPQQQQQLGGAPLLFSSSSFGRVQPITDGVHTPEITARPPNISRGEKPSALYLSQKIKDLKPHLLVALADAFKMESCLVFCRTNLDCDNLEKFLVSLGGGRAFSGPSETGKENAYSCVVLAGMRSQQERNASLAHFKAGLVRFLICTDVAARGIDIRELPFLIMMTLPDDSDLFFHRVGRVGRADRMGLAICLVAADAQERVWYHRCPNRGRGCSNTKLTTEGGCTLWYDEAAYLRAIEERLEAPLPRMDITTFAVPGIVDPFGALKEEADENIRPRGVLKIGSNGTGGAAAAATAAAEAAGAGGTAIYGKMKNDQTSVSTVKHLREIAGAVADLRKLDQELQQQFVTFAARGV